MDKQLEIAARYTLPSNVYERFVAGEEDPNLVEWTWIFEALLHSGCDIVDRWAAVREPIDLRREALGFPPSQLDSLEDYLKRCDACDLKNPGTNVRVNHLAMIDSIKRELAKL